MFLWITKHFFFSFFYILTPPTSLMLNFLIILVQIEHFKLSCNSKGNKVIFKDFLRGSEIDYECLIENFLFKWLPPTLEGDNFLASSPFLSIFRAIDASEEGSIYSLDPINNESLLQNQRAKPTLSVRSPAGLPYPFSRIFTVTLSFQNLKGFFLSWKITFWFFCFVGN
jgi:hypothetical protein